MSYELLKSLYGGAGTNADLVRKEDLALLHVETPVEASLLRLVSERKDVVLTGNPGDGKSHVVRLLLARNQLREIALEPDLSARPTKSVAAQWAEARKAGRPFVLCGNEGPLRELIQEMAVHPELKSVSAELRSQLGHLVGPDRRSLAERPERVVLIDLADRNLVDEHNVEQALVRVGQHRFLPQELKHRASQTSAGRNVMLLANSATARKRLAALIAIAARRRGGHFTFRQLWQAVSLAVTGGKAANTLAVELSLGKIGLGTFPVDNLVKPNAHGALIEAVRDFADPARVADPDLDEALWSQGVFGLGRVEADAPHEVPAELWEQGQQTEALRAHEQLKRYVAISHADGEALLNVLRQNRELPSAHADGALRERVLEGLRRLYVSPGADETLPDWLLTGLPLWVSNTFTATPPAARPHVAASARPAEEFVIQRPVRVAWLQDVLGAPPDEAWLCHAPSGGLLRLDADLLATLLRAPRDAGPLPPPDRVQRFLARIAGWVEARPDELAGRTEFAVLSRPRGRVIVHGRYRMSQEGASYAF